MTRFPDIPKRLSSFRTDLFGRPFTFKQRFLNPPLNGNPVKILRRHKEKLYAKEKIHKDTRVTRDLGVN